MFPFASHVSHTLPFSFQLQEATCQAAIMVKSHHFPSHPDVYPSISIGLGNGALTHTFTQSLWLGVACIYLYQSAGLITTSVFVLCSCQRSPVEPSGGHVCGGSLKSSALNNTGDTQGSQRTLTRIHTGTRRDRFGGRSRKLEAKARITQPRIRTRM